MTAFQVQAQELINLGVIQGIFDEEEAVQKEKVIKKLSLDGRRTARASMDSYLVRNVLTPYVTRLTERN